MAIKIFPRVELRARFRVLREGEVALGPGKAELLEAIAATGSIGEAAKCLGMSYMRGWKLIRTMNGAFAEPVVEAARGGRKHGGAKLTRTGREALRIYRAIDRKAASAVEKEWGELRGLLRE